MEKAAKWLTIILLFALTVGTVATWLLALFAPQQQSQLAMSVFQHIVQPLGAALLTGLYYWTQYLKPKPTEAISEAVSYAVAKSDTAITAMNTPQINVINTINLPSPPQPSLPNISELTGVVLKEIAERKDLTAGTIYARDIVLLDQQKVSRVVLGTNDNGASGVWANDSDGKTRLWLGVGEKQLPGISFTSRSGINKMALIDTPSVAGLTIYSESGKPLLNALAHAATADDYISGINLLGANDDATLGLIVGNAAPEGVLFYLNKQTRRAWRYPRIVVPAPTK